MTIFHTMAWQVSGLWSTITPNFSCMTTTLNFLSRCRLYLTIVLASLHLVYRNPKKRPLTQQRWPVNQAHLSVSRTTSGQQGLGQLKISRYQKKGIEGRSRHDRWLPSFHLSSQVIFNAEELLQMLDFFFYHSVRVSMSSTLTPI